MLQVDFLIVECDKTTKQNLWSPNRSNVSTSLDFILSLNIFYLPLAVDDTEICPMCIVPLCEEKKNLTSRDTLWLPPCFTSLTMLKLHLLPPRQVDLLYTVVLRKI